MSESNKKFSIQPIDDKEDKGTFQKLSEETKKVLEAHSANPGPVISDKFDAQEEGTKEERHEKAKDLNK
ncbi:hypothetical protein B0T21DRAFT_386054 [Apiosordaria backusii]|uniref:Uncharacterized protein n=1 Tax=Apiosordaria backusii TaxID=314023 RepID=A0AA40E0Z2_9PEZI|nr:hypothetical protein B0T21DRAFT_386054 [Apiosordaria backusii]